VDERIDNSSPMKPAAGGGHDTEPEREALLARTCGDDPSRRRRMAKLLDRLAASQAGPEAPGDADMAAPSTIVSDRPSEWRDVAVVRRPIEAGTLVDGRYLLDRRIGAGGMGVVFLARHVALDRRVAIKFVSNALLVDAAAVRRFEREAVVMARLKHPNIVTIYDFGVSDDAGAYYVMEMLEGVTLTQEIRKAGRLPVERAVAIVGDVCRAVEAAHAAGVIHRDLKPDNVFLESVPGGSDAVKVLDFGIAKLWETDDSDSTNAGGCIGTPAYMSPEQCRDDAVDPRSDVYALGCVLFTCLAGRPPFTGGSVVSLLARHIDAAPPRPSSFNPDLPGELDDVVLRALSKSPDDRPPSAPEFAAQIRLAIGVRTVVSRDRTKTDLRVAPASTSTPGQRPSNLPEPVTSFVGRAEDLSALVASIESSRFSTLVGPGGIGKTRLAFEVGRIMRDRFDDGVFVVDLRPCSTLQGVARAFAEPFDVSEEPDRPLLETLGEALRDRSVLVIADTCEHVVDAAGQVSEALLAAAPRLRVVTTSREALNAEGESLFHVLPLDVPRASRRVQSPDEILSASSVRLFVERAQRKRRDLDLGAENVRLIGRLCTQLDGIPLAIELAAARSNAMTVQQMVDRMGDRFALLTIGGKSGRQRTLRAVIDWSYRLLSEAERELFAQMSVFEGGCTLEAIRSVCRVTEAPAEQVHDVAAALVDKSLVTLEEMSDSTRYRMLDTIREYAAEKRIASGDEPALRRRLLEWANEESEILRAGISYGQDQKASLDRCDRESGNIRSALKWAIRDGNDVKMGMSLAAKLCHYWDMRGRALEGIAWLTEAQEAASSWEPTPELVDASFAAGFLYSGRGNNQQGLEQHERGLSVARQLGDRGAIARAMTGTSEALLFLGMTDEAEAGFRECLEMRRQHAIGREIDCVILEYFLGTVSIERAAYDEARDRIEAALEGARRLNDEWRCALMLSTLGVIALRRHEAGGAAVRFRESVSHADQIGHLKIAAHSRIGLGLAMGLDGNVDYGHELVAEGLEAAHEVGELHSVLFGLRACAILAAERQDGRRAVFLTAAAHALGERCGIRAAAEEQAYYRRYLDPVGVGVGDAAVEIARRAGSLPLEEVLAVAMDPEQDGSPSR